MPDVSLMNYLISLDSFGEPVSVNYNGESTFKTWIGAFATIVLKSFILVFALTELIALFSYKDPVITQYVVYEPRTGEEMLNLKENKASFAITLINKDTAEQSKPDPKFITTYLTLSKTVGANTRESLK